MKTIKIIDLLNKIANGEEMPKKITYSLLRDEYKILIYDEEEQEYRYENDYNEFWHVPNHHLNDEVDIIEEVKEIEKLYPTETGMTTRAPGSFELMNKINELIDVVNRLKRGN